ncbi:SNF2 family N-terminal domain-containing protein [Phaeosphaeriaceae sp. PMI808]|nr:SNF2 family N-terminal domain-containing protein [Phaeosphaeriaceae sp. PMI808]
MAWRPYSFGEDMATFAVDVNVYSLRHHADKVGSFLLHSGIFLQCPVHVPSGQDYYNPQILEVDGVHESPDEVTSELDKTSTPIFMPDKPVEGDTTPSGNSHERVELILNSLSHTGILHEIRTDTNRIKTPLMGHQMTALDFILQRESHRPSRELTFWREKRTGGETYFQHVLTKAKDSEPREARGGIIADDMGLGKSLTILSAIARSVGEAGEFVSTWTKDSKPSSEAQVASRATLIMVPSSILIDNWIDEIRAHTHPYQLTYHKHLTTDRHSEVQLLLERDIVFTTFATSLEDTKRGQAPLSKIHWFRIVLDEAHKIRNRTTKQYQAVQQVPAQRRWCLTGTPIQNCLEDLGSLIAFLRVPDLERASTFRKYIITPTSPDRGSQFQNLQLLLETVCLRRTRDILGLSEPVVQPRLLTFSSQERYQYDELYERYRRQVQMAVSGVIKVASTTLRSIHELRLFCNNGLKPAEREQRESDDEMLSYLQQLERNRCAKCSLPILCIDEKGDRNCGMFIHSCRHLVCHSCLPQCLNKEKACRLCASGHIPPDITNHISTEVSVPAAKEFPSQYPSKLLALLQDIQQEPRSKCIIFSSWKKTLDLAAELLGRASFKHDIIHGGLSLKQRLRVLKDFKSISGVNILLMTLGTGAEGLNLTIASRVYVLEPQWNPFLEQQAMARAQRIGQTKQVTCIRYLMKESIEESDVLNRRKIKTALAGGGFKKQKVNDSLQYFRVPATNVPEVVCE